MHASMGKLATGNLCWYFCRRRTAYEKASPHTAQACGTIETEDTCLSLCDGGMELKLVALEKHKVTLGGAAREGRPSELQGRWRNTEEKAPILFRPRRAMKLAHGNGTRRLCTRRRELLRRDRNTQHQHELLRPSARNNNMYCISRVHSNPPAQIEGGDGPNDVLSTEL